MPQITPEERAAPQPEPFAWYSAKVDDVILDAKKNQRRTVRPWDADHYDRPLYAVLPEAPKAPEWIPCDRRMPEPGVEVLVWGPQASMHWGLDIVRAEGEFFYASFPAEVTHWMPLPAPPAGESSKSAPTATKD